MSCGWEAISTHLPVLKPAVFILRWCWPISDTRLGLATNGSGSDDVHVKILLKA